MENTKIRPLNHDCLVKIFQYLPICDRIRLERVSKLWQDASLASWYNLKELDFSGQLWGQEWDQADEFPLEEVLSRCGDFITRAKLKPLYASNVRPSSCIRLIVGMCPNLRAVNLVGVKVCASQLRFLTEHCSNLTELCVGETTADLDDAVLESTVFDKFKLRVVELNSSDYVTGTCLKKLPADAVRKINLSYCFRLKFGVTFDALKTFRNLHTLVLRQALTLRKEDYSLFFDYLSSINLKELDVSFNDSVVDDDYLVRLASVCDSLDRLNIGGNYYVTDVGLSAVTVLSNLEHLAINWLRKVSGTDVLVDLPRLKTMSCCGCYNMEDEGLIRILKTARRIELFNLIYCRKLSSSFIDAAAKASQARGQPLMIMLNDPEKYELELEDDSLLRLI